MTLKIHTYFKKGNNFKKYETITFVFGKKKKNRNAQPGTGWGEGVGRNKKRSWIPRKQLKNGKIIVKTD